VYVWDLYGGTTLGCVNDYGTMLTPNPQYHTDTQIAKSNLPTTKYYIFIMYTFKLILLEVMRNLSYLIHVFLSSCLA
jgi:hypothetical protein